MKLIYFLTLFISLFFASSALGQTLCDTLICKDGRRIPAKIVGSKENGILYQPCNDIRGLQLFIEKEAIDTIRFQKPKVVKHSTYYYRRRNFNDMGRTTLILWLGLSFADALRFGIEGEESSWWQFGGQVNFKNSPIQVGIMLKPLRYREAFFDAFEKHGTSGEITLNVKKITVGRLTGTVNEAYWGCDFQVGRRSYSYEDSFINIPPTSIKIDDTWYAILPRIGYQFSWDIVTFDFALPIGYRSIHHRKYTTPNDSDYTSEFISIQPCISIGLRF